MHTSRYLRILVDFNLEERAYIWASGNDRIQEKSQSSSNLTANSKSFKAISSVTISSILVALFLFILAWDGLNKYCSITTFFHAFSYWTFLFSVVEQLSNFIHSIFFFKYDLSVLCSQPNRTIFFLQFPLTFYAFLTSLRFSLLQFPHFSLGHSLCVCAWFCIEKCIS